MIWLFKIKCFTNSLCLGFILALAPTSANWITISLFFRVKKIKDFRFSFFSKNILFLLLLQPLTKYQILLILFLLFSQLEKRRGSFCFCFFELWHQQKIKTKKFGFRFLVTGWCNERNYCYLLFKDGEFTTVLSNW